jgi:hypothetical protein
MSEKKPWQYDGTRWQEGGKIFPWWEDLANQNRGREVSVEELYQAFKARLMDELVALRPGAPILGDPTFTTPVERFKLIDETASGEKVDG